MIKVSFSLTNLCIVYSVLKHDRNYWFICSQWRTLYVIRVSPAYGFLWILSHITDILHPACWINLCSLTLYTCYEIYKIVYNHFISGLWTSPISKINMKMIQENNTKMIPKKYIFNDQIWNHLNLGSKLGQK